MKKCKYCQVEIDEKAKVCPHCGKKQNHLVRWILLALLIIVLVSYITGSKNQDTMQKDYAQNDSVTYKDVVYSITNVTRTRGSNEYFQAKEGYEYVKVLFRIENNSNSKISYNALDFQMVNGDGVEASYYSITAENDIPLNSGQLDAGGKVEGTIIWEQKQGDDNLKVRYFQNVLFDDDYTFQWTLN